MNAINEIIQKTKAKKHGSNYMGHCPLHEDGTPSMKISEKNGKIQLFCFACGKSKTEDLYKHFGLAGSDKRLPFYDYPPANPGTIRTFWNARNLTGDPSFLSGRDVVCADLKAGQQLRFLAYDKPDMPPCGCIRVMVDGSGVKLKDGSQQMYANIGTAGLLGLHCIADAEEVLITEGLKDWLTARSLGYAAVSGSAGAETFKPEWGRHFAGKRCAIIYDCDESGTSGANKAARILHGIAQRVRIVNLPSDTKGYDLSDYIADGHDGPDIQRLIDSTEPYQPEPASQGNPLESAPSSTQHLTDAGNAELFGFLHRGSVKYHWQRGCWLYYDGKRWSMEKGESAASRLAIETARYRLNMAAAIEKQSYRKRIIKHAFKSESNAAVKACLSLARAMPGIESHQEEFDKDDYLLNVENGTIDLHTGELRPHNPSDFITQLAPVRYPQTDDEAQCPLWMNCLQTWHRGDQQTIDYLQRLAGMCLTGDISSRKFPIFHGGGKNGKSVFLVDVLMTMMGDYACKAPRTLLKQTQYDGHPTDVAGLANKRLVVASETEVNMKLDVALVKEMTGDTVLRARFMRGDFFDFLPTHKTVLMTQNLPVIEEKADAIWDRVHKVAWPVRIPPNMQDTRLDKKLKDQWPGILKWAVEGCLKWQKDGDLLPTDSIRMQTEQYRSEQDPLRQFIENECVTGEHLSVSVTDMLGVFQSWARNELGDSTLGSISARDFSRLVTDAGFVKKNVRMHGDKVVKCWYGIGLRNEEMDDDIPI